MIAYKNERNIIGVLKFFEFPSLNPKSFIMAFSVTKLNFCYLNSYHNRPLNHVEMDVMYPQNVNMIVIHKIRCHIIILM